MLKVDIRLCVLYVEVRLTALVSRVYANVRFWAQKLNSWILTTILGSLERDRNTDVKNYLICHIWGKMLKSRFCELLRRFRWNPKNHENRTFLRVFRDFQDFKEFQDFQDFFRGWGVTFGCYIFIFGCYIQLLHHNIWVLPEAYPWKMILDVGVFVFQQNANLRKNELLGLNPKPLTLNPKP